MYIGTLSILKSLRARRFSAIFEDELPSSRRLELAAWSRRPIIEEAASVSWASGEIF